MPHAEIRALDLLGEMRAAHEHETNDGAPMLLTLVDLRPPGDRPGADVDAGQPDGAVYAQLLDAYRDELVPWARNDDQGALITVLKTIGFTAFDPASVEA